MAITFLSAQTVAILEKAQFNQDRVNLPNNSPAFKDTNWDVIAAKLGIDFAATTYTVRAVKRVDGSMAFYTPYVALNASKVPCLFWGNVEKPISEIKSDDVELSIVTQGTRPALDFFIASLEDSLVVTIMTAKGDDEGATKDQAEYGAAEPEQKVTMLRKALKLGKLEKYLSEFSAPPAKLSEYEGQTLTVISYKKDKYDRYVLNTKEAGYIKANTRLSTKLATQPVITLEAPAVLEIGVSTQKTSQGHNIYPVTLTTQMDQELPVFSFGSAPVDNETEAEYDESIVF